MCWLISKKCKVQKEKQNKFIRYRMFQRIAHTHTSVHPPQKYRAPLKRNKVFPQPSAAVERVI
jgi:hypothetical protein